MGTHKAGVVTIGAFVEKKSRDYIDKVAEIHGFSTRSDAIRAILREHRAAFADRIDGNLALTPLEVEDDENPQGAISKRTKSSKTRKLKPKQVEQ